MTRKFTMAITYQNLATSKPSTVVYQSLSLNQVRDHSLMKKIEEGMKQNPPTLQLMGMTLTSVPHHPQALKEQTQFLAGDDFEVKEKKLL